MKKLLGILCILFVIAFIPIVSNAQNTPVYDASYNQNLGAFYANGTDITIKRDEQTNETVVYWNGGSQIIPESTSIFGGGTSGTNYSSSNIIMDSGKVSYIYGGGISLEENNSANVQTSNITINGGEITGTVYGGGLIYSNVDNTNVIVNNGTIAGVSGAGAAYVVINGTEYNAGTEENPENSLNRVNNANLTINNGVINSPQLGYGLVYGGGQGYSYTGNANLTINGGDLSTAYVTAGGSNGYTGEANANINGGNINIYQSVNRGTLKTAKVRMTDGTINEFYIGGESNDSSVNGNIESIEADILGGTVTNLDKGTSGGQEITVDGKKFTTIIAEGTVVNNNIKEQEIEINYSIKANENEIKLYKNQQEKINVTISTEPTGYEYLFDRQQIKWESSDTNVATVSNDGVITAVNKGDTTITARLNDQIATIEVNVLDDTGLIWVAVIAIILVLIILLVFIFV